MFIPYFFLNNTSIAKMRLNRATAAEEQRISKQNKKTLSSRLKKLSHGNKYPEAALQ